MHECPECGRACTCGGDIDDIDFGDWAGCTCNCWRGEEDDDMDEWGDDAEAPHA